MSLQLLLVGEALKLLFRLKLGLNYRIIWESGTFKGPHTLFCFFYPINIHFTALATIYLPSRHPLVSVYKID